LQVRVHRFDGGDAWSTEIAVRAAPSSSTCVAGWSASELGAGPDRVLLVSSRDSSTPANRLFFAQPKDLDRAPAKVAADVHGRTVTLTADAYALFVHVLCDDPTVRFDDNYFDLTSGESRTITSNTPFDPTSLTVRSL
jgi:hypothetical protein